ncbi:MAG: nucleotide exchange factor GrpE [Phycisphaerae bacterium]|mgnify:CR=1 FL=1|nr:nucleotide exchange factor GrpE [Phycisphaerae bacterium]
MPEFDPIPESESRATNPDSEFGDILSGCSEELAVLIERLSAERDDAIELRKRSLADFVNFQRRASESELRARDGGIMYLARLLMPVLDQMDLSLAQNTATMTIEQLLQAISMVRSEMNKALEKSGIERVAPKSGDEFDPHSQEAVMRQPIAGVAPNHVAMCFQVGYRLGEMTLRPAKVSVTPE